MKLSFAARVERYLAEHNAPLLEAPERPSLIITASRDMASLHIGDPYEEAPFKTWREYLEDQGEIVPGKRIDFRQLRADHGIWPRELDRECPSDYWIDSWARRESSNALAYMYLERLDLGPILEGRSSKMGHLDFVDGPCPGNDYLGVQFSCDRALSHLQNRLNALRTGAAVVVVP